MTPGTSSSNTWDAGRVASLIGGVTVAVILMTLLAWFRFHTQIAQAILLIQDMELDVIGLFTHGYDQIHDSLHHAVPERVSWATLWQLCTLTGMALRIPAVVLIIALAALCLTCAPRSRYRERFGLDGMQAVLARIHPVGAAWAGGKLRLTEPAPPTKGLRPLDPALRPMEWLERYSPGDVNTEQWAETTRDALARQLGQPWTAPHALPPAELCLFMVFTFFGQRRKEEAQHLLEALSRAVAGNLKKGAPAAPVRLPKRFIRRLNQTYAANTWTEAIAMANAHAYSRPALLTLLQHARTRSGVVNPGLFCAVQLLDRDLWLALSAPSYPQHGSPLYVLSTTVCIEAQALVEHWQAEGKEGLPLREPQISRTLTTLKSVKAGFSTHDA